MGIFSSWSNWAVTAVGLAMLPGFLVIEGQIVQYLGGIVQILLAAGIVFWKGLGSLRIPRMATVRRGPGMAGSSGLPMRFAGAGEPALINRR